MPYLLLDLIIGTRLVPSLTAAGQARKVCHELHATPRPLQINPAAVRRDGGRTFAA
jgi:hypothetical protein